MKAKFVRGQNPKEAMDIGKDSRSERIKRYQALIDKGVRMRPFAYPDQGKDFEGILKYIDLISERIQMIIDAGIPPEDIMIQRPNKVEVRTYQLYAGSWGLANCYTEEDAKALKKHLEMTSTISDIEIRPDHSSLEILDTWGEDKSKITRDMKKIQSLKANQKRMRAILK